MTVPVLAIAVCKAELMAKSHKPSPWGSELMSSAEKLGPKEWLRWSVTAVWEGRAKDKNF